MFEAALLAGELRSKGKLLLACWVLGIDMASVQELEASLVLVRIQTSNVQDACATFEIIQAQALHRLTLAEQFQTAKWFLAVQQIRLVHDKSLAAILGDQGNETFDGESRGFFIAEANSDLGDCELPAKEIGDATDAQALHSLGIVFMDGAAWPRALHISRFGELSQLLEVAAGMAHDGAAVFAAQNSETWCDGLNSFRAGGGWSPDGVDQFVQSRLAPFGATTKS